MKRIDERDRMSLAQCRKILGKEYQNCTDEEIKKVRDWIYQMSELTVKFLQGKSPDEILSTQQNLSSNRNEEPKD